MAPVSTNEPAKRIAVVLFNLGGPDSLKAVRPFLFNLFADPAIIRLPAPARLTVAALISTLREASAQANYQRMGGASPLLPETTAQAAALEAHLAHRLAPAQARCFIAMRYWKPMSRETAKAVADFRPDEIVLLPLYPQFSTTTTASSLKAWERTYRGPGRTHVVCCYPTHEALIEAHAARIRAAMAAAPEGVDWRLLFSAHGLPQKVVDDGDPYQKQVEATAAAVVARLGGQMDWRICYQSRVGPMKWLGPSTPQAIEQAAGDGLGVIVCPIAFVSDHIETLVELDHEYAELAASAGCPGYVRVAALGIEPNFIRALGEITAEALASEATAPARGWTCEACGPICLAMETGGRT
jgi:protoporphyrin/coproporphyrin ferrochelatase